MKPITVSGSYGERVLDFRDLPNGQTFVYVDPPPKLDKHRGQVWIKIHANRIQLLNDPNIRIAPVYSPLYQVHIEASVKELVEPYIPNPDEDKEVEEALDLYHNNE